MSSFMCLSFGMQEEDVIEHTYANDHVSTSTCNLLTIV